MIKILDFLVPLGQDLVSAFELCLNITPCRLGLFARRDVDYDALDLRRFHPLKADAHDVPQPNYFTIGGQHPILETRITLLSSELPADVCCPFTIFRVNMVLPKIGFLQPAAYRISQ